MPASRTISADRDLWARPGATGGSTSAPSTSAAGSATPAADQPSAAARQHGRMLRFWRHHPLLLVLVLVLLAFTEYMRWDDHSPAWYTVLCGILMLALGAYMISPSGARRQAEYDRSDDRVYSWFPMPGSPTGVRVVGLIFVLVGALAAGTAAFGV